MRESEVFCTPDLYEEKNLMLVVNGLLALQTLVAGGGGSSSSASRTAAPRKFGTGGGVSKLNMGSRGIMQKTEGAYGDITRGHDAGNAGKKKKKFGTSGAVSRLNMGSRGIMQKTEGAYGDITRGHDAGNSGLGKKKKKKKKAY